MLSETPVTVGLSSPLFEAAARVSRLLEDLVASGTLHNAPFLMYVADSSFPIILPSPQAPPYPPQNHRLTKDQQFSLPAIFASIVVHASNIRRGERDVRTVSEHRAALAMHVLDRFQDMYPIAIWTRYLLDGLLRMSLGQQGQGQGGDPERDAVGEQEEVVSPSGGVSDSAGVQGQIPTQAQAQTYGGIPIGAGMHVGGQMGMGLDMGMSMPVGIGSRNPYPMQQTKSFERSMSMNMHDVPGGDYTGTGTGTGTGTPGSGAGLPTHEGVATGTTESEGGYTGSASAISASAGGAAPMSLEYWTEHRLAGVPVLFPFNNMLEDAGVDPETCFGSWNMNPGGLE
jgi:hypothetical protein